MKAALEGRQKAQDCAIFQVRSAAVLPLSGLRNGYLNHYSVYDDGRCGSLVNTDTISGSIGAFCEKRRRMQVFFSSMDTADRSTGRKPSYSFTPADSLASDHRPVMVGL